MTASGTPFPVHRRPSERDGVDRLLHELRSVQTAMMDVAVCGGGLDRVAKLASDAVHGPVAIVIPRWASAIASGEASGHDLRAIAEWAAERARARPAAVPPGVVAEVPIQLRDEVVGVVVLLRSNPPDPQCRPEATAFLHLAAVAALAELAIDDAREEMAHRLRGSFLEELRSRKDIEGAEIVRRAARLGCDLSGGGVILCAQLTSERERLVATMIATEHPGALAEELEHADREPWVYAALPLGVGDGSPAAAITSAQRLAARLRRHAIVAISTFRGDPAELGDAVREAELVLEVLQQSDASIDEQIGSGTYKLLFRMLASHPEEVKSFYETTVAPIARYDEQYRTELLQTLEAYLDANCNMNATATAIFAHRHTVAYRLERIRELSGLDPTLSEDRERLGLGLKVQRIVGSRLLG